MKTGTAAASCTPYDFSDLTGTQVQTSKAEDIFDINTRWTTFRTWFLEEKIMDPTLAKEVAEERFIGLCTNGGNRAQKVNKEWLLGMFIGAMSTERKSDGLETSIGRRGRVQFRVSAPLPYFYYFKNSPTN